MTDSIFKLDEFKPLEASWNARLKELATRASYYDGSIYTAIKNVPMFGPRLYKGIKPLYLPLSRAVDVDAGIIPGGWTMAKDTPEAQLTAQRILFDWSDWDIYGVLFVHYGAEYGVSGLKISDLREEKRVIMRPVDPQTFMLTYSGQYSNRPSMALVIERRSDSGEDFEYAEVIEPDRIRTYRNGVPWGFDGREPEYLSLLGYVPFVEIRHIETGKALGECTFQKAIPLLNEVNELASYLADIIKKHAEAQWAVIGAEPSDLVKSGDNVWFIPQGGDAKALVAAVDIAGVLAFVQEIRDQVLGSLPELAFDELKSKTQIATATLELQLMELVLKIQRSRPNYDHGLVDAMRMAGRAAATMGIWEISVLDDETLTLDAERAILPLDPLTEIELEMQQLTLERERAMGIGEGMTGPENDDQEE